MLSKRQKGSLADDLEQIKEHFIHKFSKININRHLNNLLQSLIENLIEKEKLVKAAPLRIIHSRCTPEKVIFE